MSRSIENECVGCDVPCMGGGCPLRHVEHFYCDECGDETQLYDFDGQELCLDCIEAKLDKIN